MMCIKSHNVPPEPPLKKANYNPTRDFRAYYFDGTGNKVRQCRNFQIDKDKWVQEKQDEQCQKVYPTALASGTTYLFLWMCPKHNYCLGFHLIPGSEGPKDAMHSLYQYSSKAPQVILYDNSCHLAEMIKNRESGYFENTMVYSDIFHSVNHKCSDAFKIQRLPIGNDFNTSGCEQLNSFLGKIKSSAKFMGIENFIYYLQYFIHQHNNMHFKSYNEHQKIIKDGYL